MTSRFARMRHLEGASERGLSAVRVAVALVMAAVSLWAATSLAVGLAFEARRSETRRSAVLAVDRPRVVVLKSRRVLHLFDGENLVRSYRIGLGKDPLGAKIKAGDNRTPIGRFRVCTKNPDSQYHRFLGIDYPDVPAARRGLRQGLITQGEMQSIELAHQQQRMPSWTTALGGGIGLHGQGSGADWTAGCIALENDQIEELYNVLRLGDPIEILP